MVGLSAVPRTKRTRGFFIAGAIVVFASGVLSFSIWHVTCLRHQARERAREFLQAVDERDSATMDRVLNNSVEVDVPFIGAVLRREDAILRFQQQDVRVVNSDNRLISDTISLSGSRAHVRLEQHQTVESSGSDLQAERWYDVECGLVWQPDGWRVNAYRVLPRPPLR